MAAYTSLTFGTFLESLLQFLNTWFPSLHVSLHDRHPPPAFSNIYGHQLSLEYLLFSNMASSSVITSMVTLFQTSTYYFREVFDTKTCPSPVVLTCCMCTLHLIFTVLPARFRVPTLSFLCLLSFLWVNKKSSFISESMNYQCIFFSVYSLK